MKRGPTRLREFLQPSQGDWLAYLAQVRIVREVWYQVLPYEIAEKTFPLRTEGDTLVVGVPHPTYGSEVLLRSREILQELKARFPYFTARRIRWELWEEEPTSSLPDSE